MPRLGSTGPAVRLPTWTARFETQPATSTVAATTTTQVTGRRNDILCMIRVCLGRYCRLTSFDAICKIAYRAREILRVVPFQDGAEVVEDEERRPVAAARQQERGLAR